MIAAVRVHKVGGPEVLTYEEIDIGAPGQGQIRVKQHACGVNFIDTYFRMGIYPSPVGLPFVAGIGSPTWWRSVATPRSAWCPPTAP
jgi:NADPH2:quinone reductase